MCAYVLSPTLTLTTRDGVSALSGAFRQAHVKAYPSCFQEAYIARMALAWTRGFFADGARASHLEVRPVQGEPGPEEQLTRSEEEGSAHQAIEEYLRARNVKVCRSGLNRRGTLATWHRRRAQSPRNDVGIC
jgi:hypothetical protein